MKYQLQEKMIYMLSSTLGESDISKSKSLSRSLQIHLPCMLKKLNVAPDISILYNVRAQ